MIENIRVFERNYQEVNPIPLLALKWERNIKEKKKQYDDLRIDRTGHAIRQ